MLKKILAFFKAVLMLVVASVLAMLSTHFFLTLLIVWVWVAPVFDIDVKVQAFFVLALIAAAFYEKVSDVGIELRKIRHDLEDAQAVTNNYFQVKMPEPAPETPKATSPEVTPASN